MSRKRPADEAAGPSKRTRFQEPEEAHFEETVDESLETGTRRGAVKNEGYESDSTDDGEGVVFSRQKKDAEDADGDDMFATDDKPNAGGADAGKKKKTEYLNLGDIEGQEFGSGAGGKGGSEEVESEESEDEEDALDEDDRERIRREKAKGYDDKSMGFELSSFNMKAEMEEGKFASDGSYVRSADPLAMHDRWLDGMSEREIKLARKAHKARLKKEAVKEQQEEGTEVRREERERDLVCLMRPSESVLEALQRLGAKKKCAHVLSLVTALKLTLVLRAQDKKAKRKDGMALDKGTPTKSQLDRDIERVTELASDLMVDNIDIYTSTYEELLRSVRRSKIVEPDWKPPETDTKVEYRWRGGDGATFGPFSIEEMSAWREADYFGLGAEKIELRKAGTDSWAKWDEVIED